MTSIEYPPISAESEKQQEVWLDFVTNIWSRTVVQPLLIAFLTTAFIIGPLIILKMIMPGSPWGAFSLVCFIVALESIYTTIWLTRPSQRPLNKFAYRTAEFVFIAIVIRLLVWVLTGNWPTMSKWETYLFEPFSFFADSFFLGSLLLIFFVWQRALSITETFSALAIDRAEAAFYAEAFGKHKLETRPTVINRGFLVSSFLHQWLLGGLLLVACAAVSTFEFSSQATGFSPFALARLDLPPAMITALLIYFLSGFLLLSQGRLAMMNARWLINGVQKSEQVERGWYRNSLRLLALVGFVAAFLPLGSTIAFGRILAAIISVITAVMTTLLILLITLLSWLFPSRNLDPGSIGQVAPPPILPTPPPPTQPNETASMVFSSAFWAVVIFLSAIAIMFFLRERGVRIDASSFKRVWTLIKGWLSGLWRGFSNRFDEARQTVRRLGLAKPKLKDGLPQPRPWRFIRLNALSPREQLRYFYLSTVRRAGERGVSRQESETPLEYSQGLKAGWPEAEMDVESLTDAFLKARYSPTPIVEDEVKPVKDHWKHLRSNLRQRSQQQGEDTARENQ